MNSRKPLRMMSPTGKGVALRSFEFIAISSFLGLSLFACAANNKVSVPDAEVAAYLADKPPAYHEDYKQILQDDKKNECLNFMRLGLKAMQNGSNKVAESAFDTALVTIDGFFVNTESAQKARSLWYEEGMKDFKGEPYERVMTFYYRGLLYLNAGDYDNARASFKSAIIQDAFAEEQQYQSDFALVVLLEGLAAKLSGDNEGAENSFSELKKLRPDFVVPEQLNTLFIVESGTAPRKVADGPGHSELKYFRGRNFLEKKVTLKINNESKQSLYPIEDIFFQASTRGGRQIDKILKDKLVFRQTNLAIGSTLSNAGSTAMLFAPLAGANSGTFQGIAGGLAIAGALEQLIAINAKPHADTRFWDNLPDSVHIGFGQLNAGSHNVVINALDEKGSLVKGVGKTVPFDVDKTKRLNIVWVKLR